MRRARESWYLWSVGQSLHSLAAVRQIPGRWCDAVLVRGSGLEAWLSHLMIGDLDALSYFLTCWGVIITLQAHLFRKGSIRSLMWENTQHIPSVQFSSAVTHFTVGRSSCLFLTFVYLVNVPETWIMCWVRIRCWGRARPGCWPVWPLKTAEERAGCWVI